MITRICKKCLETKQLDLFTISKTCKGGRRYVCKACDAIRQKEYAASEAGKAKRSEYETKDTTKAKKREWHLKNNYRTDETTYNALFEKQCGCCAICGTTEPNAGRPSYKFAIDHCHSTGAVRGLLCKNCNTGLGLFKDSTPNLERAISYLTSN